MVDSNWGGASADRYDLSKMEKEEAPAVERSEAVGSTEAGARVFESVKAKLSGLTAKASKVGTVLGKFGLRMLAPKHLAVETGQAIGGAAAEAGKAVGGAAVEAGKAVGGAVVSGAEAVGGAAAKGVEVVGGTVIRGAEAVGGAAVTGAEVVGGAAVIAGEYAAEGYKYVSEATKAKATEISERATDAFERADTWVGDTANKASEAIEAAGQRTAEATTVAIGKIKDGGTQAWARGVVEPVAAARAFTSEKWAGAVEWDRASKLDGMLKLRGTLERAIALVDARIAKLQGGEADSPEADVEADAATTDTAVA